MATNNAINNTLGVATGTSFNTITGVAAQSDQEAGTSIVTAVTPGVQQFHPSAAKVWVQCGVTGNIIGSYNVTSVTDAGVGVITVNFTVSFSGTNYSSVISVAGGVSAVRAPFASTFNTGSYWGACVDALGNLVDPAGAGLWCVTIFGDQ